VAEPPVVEDKGQDRSPQWINVAANTKALLGFGLFAQHIPGCQDKTYKSLHSVKLND
jgi:hypothetical protein